MLKKILTLPRDIMDEMLARGEPLAVLKGKTWALVSISTEKEHLLTDSALEKLRRLGCRQAIRLVFWDSTPSVAKTQEMYGHKPVLFSKEQAREVIEFLDGVKESDVEIFVAQCEAGISRSGAVGSFACDYLGFDYPTFASDNSDIMPNPHVERMLRRAGGMTPIGYVEDVEGQESGEKRGQAGALAKDGTRSGIGRSYEGDDLKVVLSCWNQKSKF